MEMEKEQKNVIIALGFGNFRGLWEFLGVFEKFLEFQEFLGVCGIFGNFRNFLQPGNRVLTPRISQKICKKRSRFI
jgi:hypothetical protein